MKPWRKVLLFIAADIIFTIGMFMGAYIQMGFPLFETGAESFADFLWWIEELTA